VDKLHSLTGFRPQTPLNQIIDRVAAHFQQRSDGMDRGKIAAVSAS